MEMLKIIIKVNLEATGTSNLRQALGQGQGFDAADVFQLKIKENHIGLGVAYYFVKRTDFIEFRYDFNGVYVVQHLLYAEADDRMVIYDYGSNHLKSLFCRSREWHSS